MGRTDVTFRLHQATAQAKDVPVNPVAIDAQCRLWAAELAFALAPPEAHFAGYLSTNPVFTTDSPLPASTLDAIRAKDGWAAFDRLDDHHYQATTGPDCRANPRQTAARLIDSLTRTNQTLSELNPDVSYDFQNDELANGNSNASPSPPRRDENTPVPRDLGVYLQSQDNLMVLQPLRAWIARWDQSQNRYYAARKEGIPHDQTQVSAGDTRRVLTTPLFPQGLPLSPGQVSLTLTAGQHRASRTVQIHPQPNLATPIQPQCSGDIQGVHFAAEQIVVRLKDKVPEPQSFIWALAASRHVRGDVIASSPDGKWHIIRTTCPADDPGEVFEKVNDLLTDSHKYVGNAAPRRLHQPVK